MINFGKSGGSRSGESGSGSDGGGSGWKIGTSTSLVKIGSFANFLVSFDITPCLKVSNLCQFLRFSCLRQNVVFFLQKSKSYNFFD